MAALDTIASELLKSANEADLNYKKTRDQTQLDKAVRLRRIVENLKNLTLGASDLNGLSDVTLTGVTNGQVLLYNGATEQWVNGSAGGGGDMLKSTYDVDNTGVVDNAESISIIGRNSTGATLYKGTVVYISGSTGNRPNFAKAQANAEATSAGTFGVVRADIPNNSDGYVVCIGYIDNLDTRSTAPNPFTNVTLADGDTVYLHPTIAGYITNVKPSAPNHVVYVGKVTRTSPTNGTIVYRIQNGYELDEIHDVAISSKANNDLLVYESATSLWKNKTFAAIFGGTPLVSVPTLDQVTTAGNTTTNAITVGSVNSNGNVVIGGATSSGAFQSYNGYYAFSFGTNVSAYNPNNNYTRIHMGASITYTDNFSGNFLWRSAGASVFEINNATINFWNTSSVIVSKHNASTGNFLIGTTTDAGYRLDVNGTGRFSDTLLATANASNHLGLIVQPNSQGNAVFRYLRTATTNFATFEFANGSVSSSVAKWGIGLRETNDNDFHFYNHTASKDQLVIKDNTGNVLIGTTTDAGYKLQVQGSGYFNTNTASTNSVLRLTDANTGTAWAGFSSSTTTGFFIGSNGGITLGQVTADNSNPSTAHARISINSLGNPGLQLSTNSANVGIVFSDGVNATIRMNFPSVGEAAITTISAHNLSIGVASSVGSLSSTTMKFFQSTGNVAINSTTDAGYKLDVNGTIRSSGTNGLVLYDGTYGAKTSMVGYVFTIEKEGANGPTVYNFKYSDNSDALYLSNTAIRGVLAYDAVMMSRSVYAPHNGAFGFVTYAGTTQYKAIQAIYTDNNTSGVAFNYKTAGTDTEAMRITSTGNVGVGTSSPAYKFHISSSAAANIFGTVQSTSANGTAAWVAFNDQNDNVVYRVFGSGASGSQMGFSLSRTASLIANLGGSGKFLIGTYSGTDLIFGTSDNARLRLVDSTGNFLVGTMTDYGNKLEVSGTINATAYKINGILGWSGIINIPTIPPISITVNNGIITNVM